ncbi:hypothetical protein BCV72DRAFT_263341 [Rhizopus microsporus var. microsporus]|uniref:Uncharacterized protein n=2 Tax=Rhizopus microsporus TaxID=58291 RepID=A0A2G4TAJ0_RHIZD|nr:uncharacterized protein RHIMIDRAFT_255404 [Rhizopus microsporus ATCC 52813]ORE05413.1 hypothetical protein BCV72DRAFT_263341 [Rhizopus microsporus var. microsporus]PHZ18032.1 hypothetical protein RHIMIDRAFT_255404 [Rhizopus microsporus ATCC 52813]
MKKLILYIALLQLIVSVTCQIDWSKPVANVCLELYAPDFGANNGRIGISKDGYGKWALDSDNPWRERYFRFYKWDRGYMRSRVENIWPVDAVVLKGKAGYYIKTGCDDYSVYEPWDWESADLLRLSYVEGSRRFKICHFEWPDICYGRNYNHKLQWIYSDTYGSDHIEFEAWPVDESYCTEQDG